MDNAQFTVDADEVMKLFSSFNDRERRKVFKSAINKSLQIVKKQTLVNLENVIEPDKINFKDEFGNSFKTGITTKIWKNRSGGTIAIVKNFKMKFFESGTKARYTKNWRGTKLKKKRYTGKIKAYHYFKNAKEQTEKQVFDNIENLLKQAINKINNKRK